MAKKKKKVVKKKKVLSKKKSQIKKNLKKKKTPVKTNKTRKTKTIKKTKKLITNEKLNKSKIKTLKEDKPKKIPKAISGFDEKIKEIFAKLINKHTVDGIYTQKIIEKAIPKKFRVPENVSKVEEFLRNNKVTIVSEKEAAELD